MEFVCSTRYSPKTLTAMARALRKTVRVKMNLWLKVVCAVLIGICLLSIYASRDDPWYVGTNGVVIVFLLVVQWKQDWLNGYIARRRALPGTEFSSTTFHQDYFETQIAGAVTQWQYDKVTMLAESKACIFFIMGKNHASAFEKEGVEGGSVAEFRRFLEERTGKQIKFVGG
ncbi:YcxB family protein [Flavonifractor plautii]|uniref:YcxB family protein n=1 Tax=Flavonifractor plautii TaxID=292800 RepID=UPI00195CB30F|nr:YcxB family protein [Flavonifractor plautii]MBM6664479.1 YcxB family protein [Flavonifractor plautii]